MTGYEIQFEYDAGEDMPRDYKYCFIAVTKEALSNIVKHSDGKKVSVQLLEHPGFYQLVVEDNGRQSKNGDKNGMGIENMKERVRSLGGTLLIQRDTPGDTGSGWRTECLWWRDRDKDTESFAEPYCRFV